MHVPRLERLLAAYDTGEPDVFAATFIGWDRECSDVEAARIVTELLAVFVDEKGALVRLSDDAVRGAIRWMARSAALSSTERADALRTLLSSTTPEAVRQTTRVLETAAAMDDATALVADHSGARRRAMADDRNTP
jgi:hypothetical protein